VSQLEQSTSPVPPALPVHLLVTASQQSPIDLPEKIVVGPPGYSNPLFCVFTQGSGEPLEQSMSGFVTLSVLPAHLPFITIGIVAAWQHVVLSVPATDAPLFCVLLEVEPVPSKLSAECSLICAAMPHHMSTLTLSCTDTDALLHVHPPVQAASVVTPLQGPGVESVASVEPLGVPQVFAVASQAQPPSQVACVVAEVHKVWSDLPPVHFAVRVARK